MSLVALDNRIVPTLLSPAPFEEEPTFGDETAAHVGAPSDTPPGAPQDGAEPTSPDSASDPVMGEDPWNQTTDAVNHLADRSLLDGVGSISGRVDVQFDNGSAAALLRPLRSGSLYS